ncbi:MAG TPA: tyrosine--tRNA ligase [Solirubrobacteraceae bacterium]|jgi:tyrosyl-tRNA synthetase|nr:tyrosine--tRNA ligase [Solirubrobacteraceae bacterium]
MANSDDAAAQAAAELSRRLASGAVDSLPRGGLEERLLGARSEKRPLRVKLGIDPTAPDIHLGHAVVLGKLREFQDAGHRVVLIVGDYTARVGDPSGRSEQRPMLSAEEIDANAETFQQQALKILDGDPDRLEVRRNSEWLDMPMSELLKLVATTTAAQLLEREDFAKRIAAGQSVSMLELLYPLLQGYDSVAIDADVELGGTDQKFNLLLGRDIQRAYGRPEQAIMTMPILVGSDGRRKMSKSLGNEIGITDSPQEMYGKTMAIPDEAIAEYRRLLLDPRSGGESGEQGAASEPGGAVLEGRSARDAKRELARDLVAWLHSPEDAEAAERHFDRVFVEHEAPEQIEEATFDGGGGLIHVPLVISEQFGVSRSEARRLIDQGGVTLGEVPLAPGEHDVEAARADGQVLKVGRRRFRRLRKA